MDVIGIWDAEQDQETCPFEWESFVTLINEGFSLMDAMRGTYRKNGIFDLENYLRRVGLAPVLPAPIAQLNMKLWLSFKAIGPGPVIGLIYCVENTETERVKVSFALPYNKKNIAQAVEIINHNMYQYLSLMRSLDAKVSYCTCIDGDDEPTFAEDDEQNLKQIGSTGFSVS